MVSNSKPIETVMAEASDHLIATGSLDTAEWVARYPQHSAEIIRLFPVMRRLEEERRWIEMERQVSQFAIDLFTSPAGEG